MKTPRLRWVYSDDGRTRAARWHGKTDVRTHRPAKFWTASADCMEYHPITGEKLKNPGWFVVETRE